MHGTSCLPQRIYTATTALCAIGMAMHFAWLIRQWLSGPPSPDLYANHPSFILGVFVLFWAPLWLLGLLLILVAEFALFGRKQLLPDTSPCD